MQNGQHKGYTSAIFTCIEAILSKHSKNLFIVLDCLCLFILFLSKVKTVRVLTHFYFQSVIKCYYFESIPHNN